VRLPLLPLKKQQRAHARRSCFRYGLNGHAVDPPLERMIQAYPRRADLIGFKEPGVQPLSAATKAFCKVNEGYCRNLPTSKTLIVPNGWDARFRTTAHIHYVRVCVHPVASH